MADDQLEREIAALIKHSERLQKRADETRAHADEVTRKLTELLRRQADRKAKR